MQSERERKFQSGRARLWNGSFTILGHNITFEKAKRVLQGTSAAALSLVVLGACGANNTPTPTEETSNVQEMDDGQEDDVQQEESWKLAFDILGDRVSGIDFQNHLPTLEDLLDELKSKYDTYEGDVVTHTSEDGTETQWTSEEDLKKAEEAGLVDEPVGTEKTDIPTDSYVDNNGKTVTSDVFVAPDGSVWANKEQYDEFVAGQGQGEKVIDEGEGWRDPETGEVWASKEEYDKFKASNNGQTVTPVAPEDSQPGVKKDELGGYVNEDGYYIVGNEAYISKEEYLDLLKNEGTVIPVDSKGEQNPSNTITDSQDTIQRDELGGYYNEEGYYVVGEMAYESKEDYLAISGQTTDNGQFNQDDNFYEEEAPVQKDELGGYYTQDGYYVVDGNYYASKETYLAINGQTTDNDQFNQDDNFYEEEAPVQKDELGGYYTQDGYYVVDGNYYASKETYLAINGQTTENDQFNQGTGSSYEEESTVQKDELGGYYTQDGFYVVDGDYYASKETYLEIIGLTSNSNNYTAFSSQSLEEESSVTTDELGGYVNEDGYYIVDGFAYESKEDYIASIQPATASETQAPTEQVEKDELGGYVNEEGYYIVDGVAYGSKEAYVALNQEKTTAETQKEEQQQTIVTDELGGYVSEDGYYVVDGTYYESKEAYLATLNTDPSLTSEETGNTQEYTAEIVYDELGGYVSEDGYYIVAEGAYPSKLDYLEIEGKLDELGGYMGNDEHYYVIKGEQNGKYESKDAYIAMLEAAKENSTAETTSEQLEEGVQKVLKR